MTNAWDERALAQEEQFFDQTNREALARLAARRQQKARTCPVDGAELTEQQAQGVIIDRCEKCGGVWLDAGELDALTAASQQKSSLVEILFGTKKKAA